MSGQRLETVFEVLGRCGGEGRQSLDDLESILSSFGTSGLWLAMAVLTGELPAPDEIANAFRRFRLGGIRTALGGHLDINGDDGRMLEVVRGQVLVDLTHTASTDVTSGVQRVARAAASQWVQRHEVCLVRWTDGYKRLRRLTPSEYEKVVGIAPQSQRDSDTDGIVVPWMCTVLVPELSAEPERAKRYLGLARYSTSVVSAIGFDCVPLTAADTCSDGMPGFFGHYLASLTHANRVAAISAAAAREYAGWKAMLAGSGRSGPEIGVVELTVEPRSISDEAIRAARELMIIGSLPLVLVVGSHEPRKNHLAILQAAEILWREGLRFTLTFVGGNAWRSGIFDAQVRMLQSRGRPVQTVMALPEEILWAAYRIAYCTVFVSNHEGYGLPVAESLVSGTPVVTSNFGNMFDLAQRGGAITVDPRSDDEIAAAIRRLLLDSGFRDRLADEAAQLEWRTWDDYAKDAWEFLMGPE
jgi:glycosyltransferase involved in cell wall biosynthesis